MKTPLCWKTAHACYTYREHTCVLAPPRAAKATNNIEGKSESKLGRRESNPHYRGLPQYVPCLLTEKATNRL